MNKRNLVILTSLALAAGALGCKSTAQQVATTSAAATPSAPATVASKRLSDTSYAPRAVQAKVDPKGTGFVGKGFVVEQLMVDGKLIYRVTENGQPLYYDARGVEVKAPL
jgi:hypothetical protein